MLNTTMAALSARVHPTATDMGLTRQRGGAARGVWWMEMSGRINGVWYEMRFHEHRDGRLQVGALGYQPLTMGGRTVVIGSHEYEPEITDRLDRLADDALSLLDHIRQLESKR